MAYVVNKGTRSSPNYYARVKTPDGKWTTRPTDQTTKAAALVVAEEMQARVTRGLLAIPEPDDKETRQRIVTVKELVTKFCESAGGPRIRDIPGYRARMRSVLTVRIIPMLGALPASAVTPLHVKRLRDDLRERYDASSVNTALDVLSTLFGWAASEELINCRNPVTKIERMPAERSQDFFSLKEVWALLKHCQEHAPDTFPMAATALYTGMRKGELLGLLWKNVRLDGDLPYLDVKHSYRGPTKTRKNRAIPVHASLLPILREWRERCPASVQWDGEKWVPDDVVFPVAVRHRLRGVIRHQMGDKHDMEDLRGLLLAAKCHVPKYKPWTAVRHTWPTHFLEAGGTLEAREMIMGHRMPGSEISAGYTHASLSYLAREMAKLCYEAPLPADISDLTAERRKRQAEGR